jgi:hypothetical protein
VSVTIFRDLNIRYNNQNHVYNNSLLLNFWAQVGALTSD